MIDELLMRRPAYSLRELNSIIRTALNEAFPGMYWVVAEIAECKCNQRGHCYLELVEKEDDRTIAQVKATIWAYEYRKLGLKFKMTTGESLKPGMKILLLAAVTFHEVYGLSLNVKDIDPAYTMGEMARRKKEIIEQLTREGLVNLNKSVPLPLVPQRIAVVSSPTAAGYGDFFGQLDTNVFGYTFSHVLFPAVMQGDESERSIIAALDKITRQQDDFDVVVVIRGGGSSIDLNCFDSYALAACIARFPLPVITGIGHEKDDTVVDLVAHTRMKTPTAVAEFLISGVRSFEEKVLDLQNRLHLAAGRLVTDENYRLDALAQQLAMVPVRVISLANRLLLLEKDLSNRAARRMQREQSRLAQLEQAVMLLDPARVLKRGYSITRCNGKVLKDTAQAKSGDVLETRLYNGSITSIVGQKEEAQRDGKKQGAYLLPGFD
ncbi:MAG: exodeoxyribonuclease VII large subunit [Nitrospirota bacterium]